MLARLPTYKRLVLAMLGVLLTASCAQIVDRLDDLPDLEPSDLNKIRLAQSSKIYDAKGELITTLHGEQNRTIIPLGAIPKHVQRAVIAIEDERFYEHGGVDWQAIARAAVANLASGEIREGGSTITQQYVKNVLIAPDGGAEKTFERKLNEAALSRQLEQELEKNDILERYLNTVYFGKGAYGIQAAAKTFFGVPARRLTIAQAALLAGMIRTPERYDPFDNPKQARQRRDLVISKMRELSWITEKQARRALRQPLRLQRRGQKRTYPAPYFIDYVQRLLTYDPRFEFLGKTAQERTKQLFQGGLRIHTTVDLEAQAAAESAIEEVLPYPDDPHASLVSIDPATGYVKAMVGGRDWFAPRKQDRYAKFNLAIQAEPGLGCVRNARGQCKEPLEPGPAPGTGRQAGSAFKTFALVSALDEGVPLSKTYRASACMDFPGANNGKNWRVCNYEESDFGSQISLLEATVMSVNVVYAQLILEIGPEGAVEAATEMGINTNLLPVPSAALGTNPVNPLGMASAFGTLANNGVHVAPVAITKVEGPRGVKTLYEDETEPERVIDAQVAYLATGALEQVIQRGTGTRANIGRPAAGKTGTAQEYRDAWFIGYTPDLVTAVWVGYPAGEIEMKPYCSVTVAYEAYGEREVCRPTRIYQTGVTGGSYPAEIWHNFMLVALADVPPTAFRVPKMGTVTVTIDTRTQCLAGRFTPEEYRAEASFARGTEPTEECRLSDVLIEVPDVFGLPAGDAARILQDEGFVVVAQEQASTTYPPGRVIGQDPSAGTQAPAGSQVVIVVSVSGGDADADTEATVPNVLGYTRGAAEAALRNSGFSVSVVYERESNGKDAKRRKGRVWKQSPSGGEEADRGSTVTIWVNP